MIKLAVFVSFVAAGICLNSRSNHIKKIENNQLLLPNTFESYKTSIFEVFTATVSNLSEIEKTDSLFQRKKLASNNNIMSYFNARNLSSSQLDTLRTLLNGACWRDSFGRGAGESVSDCSSAQEKDGALCYPKCDEGFKGVGPVCWEICRPGFVDRGIFCIIDLHIFNKGCCCVLNDCCKNCPTNYTDDGCTCRRPPVSYTKKSYGRGTGIALNCKENYELNGLLCYPMCQEDYTGNGPVCWKKCSEPLAETCGAMCTINQDDCIYKSFNFAFIAGLPLNAMTALIAGPDALTSLESVVDIPVQFSMPKCF